MRTVLSSLLLLAGACAPPPDGRDPALPGNNPPTAMLKAPVIAPLDQPVRLDASASQDDDGDPLTYVFQFNDGSEALHSADAVVLHTFTREALYTVVVRVVDLMGDESMAEQDVTVRAEYPDPPDFCLEDHDCVVGDECDGGVCYSNGGTVE